MQFYKFVKEKMHILPGEESKKRYQIHKKFLNRIKLVLLVFYIIIIPYCEAPDWCIDQIREAKGGGKIVVNKLILHCQDRGVPFSKTLTVSPFYTSILDLFIVIFLAFMRWYKTTWKRVKNSDKKQNGFMLMLFVAISIDTLISAIRVDTPYFSRFCKPFIIGSFMVSVRLNAWYLLKDIYDSSAVLLSIFLFIFIYSTVGYYLFCYSF